MISFETSDEAKSFIQEQIDLPVTNFTEHINEEITLRAFHHELENGCYTNIYDISFRTGAVEPKIVLHDKLTGVFDYAITHPNVKVAMNGGFFFLSDEDSASPKQPSLNFALENRQIKSLPVVDREALILDQGRLSVEHLEALGSLVINDTCELSWSGSLTERDTDVTIFGNGNSVIRHVKDPITGAKRVLSEPSRYTPPILTDDTVDIGFVSRCDGIFEGVNKSTKGEMDIFDYEMVARTHERYAHTTMPLLSIRSIGRHALDGTLESGISIGAMLDTQDFTTHPLNSDRSLGCNSPLQEVPMPRATIFETADNYVHLRLFDGRPGSETFTGVTPTQAADIILSEQAIIWGGFLDSGQTAKLISQQADGVESYGNRHYLQWPKKPHDPYIWVPKTGRPVSSMITLY